MYSSSIRAGAQTNIKEIPSEKVSEKAAVKQERNAVAEKFKQARNEIINLAKTYNPDAAIDGQNNIKLLIRNLKDTFAPLSERNVDARERLQEKIKIKNQYRKEIDAAKSRVEKNKGIAEKITGVSAEKIRSKHGEIMPCYEGFTHLRKRFCSSSYMKPLKEIQGKYKTLDRKSILDKINSRMDKDKKIISNREGEIKIIDAQIPKKEDKIKFDAALKVMEESSGRMEKNNAISSVKGTTSNKNIIAEKREAFCSLYSTNAGSQAINLALSSNIKLDIDMGKVIQELKTRSGDQYFEKGGRRELEEIKSLSKITLEDLKSFFKDEYNSSVKKNKKARETYRGQNISPTVYEQLQECQKNKVLFNPGYLMSTSASPQVAEDFIKDKDIKLFVEVKGKTGMSIYSNHVVSKEEEYAFTPESKFEIECIGFNAKNKRYEMQLIEKMPRQYEGREFQTFARY